MAATGVLAAGVIGVGVASASSAPPAGCGHERSPCQKATIELQGFSGAKLTLSNHYDAGCVVGHTPEADDLDPADLDTVWVTLSSKVQPSPPCLNGGSGGVRWRISWPKGPDGESSGSILLRQWLGRSKSNVTMTLTCDDADGVRCRIKGGDKIVLTRAKD
jgi:hypothetical protein